MTKRPRHKLLLTTESLRVLSPESLRDVRGGTDLVTVADPVPAPKTDRTNSGKSPFTGTCACVG